jgi:hypothetical protein
MEDRVIIFLTWFSIILLNHYWETQWLGHPIIILESGKDAKTSHLNPAKL